jgi:signal transduction histidine kinase
MSNNEPVILYVDDERGNRVVFEQSFARRFRVHAVESGAAALDFLKNNTVAVLVTDQRMPDMSGNELLMRAKELYPDTVRVVITAYSELDPILRAVNDGLVARYIVKPWDRSELEKVLRWGLETFLLGRQNSTLQLRLLENERLATLGSIGAAIFHDVNQPLAYLSSNSERLLQLAPSVATALKQLLEAHGDEVDPTVRRLATEAITELPGIAGDMLGGCRHIMGLAGGIRRMVRPAADARDRVCEPLNVIRYALSVCRDIAVRGGGTIVYDGPQALRKAAIGTTELTQVLINLIANAAQAIGRRKEASRRVLISVAEGHDSLRVVVTDDGPGMSPEVLARIGTPFFSTREEGTGLGVSQCRRLIEQAGGELTIASIEGTGTTVTVRLPLAT